MVTPLLFSLILLGNGVVTFIFGLAFMVSGSPEKKYFTAFTAGSGLVIGMSGMMQIISVLYVIYQLLTGGI